MRFVAFADLHLGVTTYGHVDPVSGLNSRVLDALASLDAMVDHVLSERIDLVVCVGDVYKNPAVSNTITNEFDKRVRRLVDHHVRVILLDGNHDVSKMPQLKSPLARWGTLQVPGVSHDRFLRVHEHGGVRFVLLPTHHSKEDIADALLLTDVTSQPTVLLFHGTVEGAMLNDWNVAAQESYVPLSTFSESGALATLMGHLHKHQVLHGEPPVLYLGSLQRVDFSEERQPKGFTVCEVVDGRLTWDFVEVPSQVFVTLDVVLGDEADPTAALLTALQPQLTRVTPGAIVRVRVKLAQRQLLDEQRVLATVYAAGAGHVLDLQKTYPTVTAARETAMVGTLTAHEALALYYREHPHAESLLAQGYALIDRLHEEGRL